MNEKRFIQLINFQIDGEISSMELEELEQEVASDPRRGEIYHSYSRLQQASELVYNQFGEALAETVDLKKYQILARNSNQGLRRGLLFSAGALAAACLSVVAAIAVFQDTEWGASDDRVAATNGFGAVEVLEPGVLNKRGSSFRNAGSPSAPEAFSFVGATRGATRSFQASIAATVWDEELRPASSGRVIRSQVAFDAPELASFQFQR